MISPDEYEVYSAVCCQTDLFLFGNPDTVFLNETRAELPIDDIVGNGLTVDRLEGLFKYRCAKHPEMIDDFNAKNADRWKLEPNFRCPNGYQLASEGDSDVLPVRPFVLARVGFNSDRSLALTYVEYFGCCAYYLLFERLDESQPWCRKDHCLAWVA